MCVCKYVRADRRTFVHVREGARAWAFVRVCVHVGE